MERKIKVDLHPRATSKNQSQIQDSKLGNGTYGIQQSSKFPSPFQHIAPSGKLTNLRNKWRVGNFNRKYSALQGSPISCNGNGKISDDFKRGLNHICIMHQHKSEIIPLLFTNWALQDAYWLKRARSPALHVHMPFLQGYQLQSSLTNSPTSAYMPYTQAIHTNFFLWSFWYMYQKLHWYHHGLLPWALIQKGNTVQHAHIECRLCNFSHNVKIIWGRKYLMERPKNDNFGVKTVKSNAKQKQTRHTEKNATD